MSGVYSKHTLWILGKTACGGKPRTHNLCLVFVQSINCEYLVEPPVVVSR